MARISYVEEKDHPELAADIAKIKGARGGLINIYKLLLHSPTVTMTWFEHIGAIRWKTKLTPRLREIAIVRVAQAAKYAYALNQHVPHIAVPDGVSVEECEALKDWRASKFFREPERAALAYVDAMIAGPEVPDDVFNAMRKHYNEREVVELTVLVGTYLMHNRVFTALRVDVEPKKIEGCRVPSLPVIVVEDDPFTRLIPLVLDPKASEERRAAFADFMSTDESDFAGWCERVRQGSAGLYPAEVRMVTSEAEMRANLKDCVALVVESFRVGRDDLAAASRLKVVQKFGTNLRNIDTAACTEKNIKLLTLRRRANISCAEHAFGLILLLARKLDELDGLVTVKRIAAARGAYRPFQRNHTPGGNYVRLSGTRALNGATIGIIGLGEIGREIAIRARAFDMNVLYHQRTRAPDAEERELKARHVPLPTLLSESDWIVPQLPTGPSTRDLLGRTELSQVSRGACIVNVANAPIINRDALIEALHADRLGGVALDVHYQEPLPDDDELLAFDNVILTPRMAGSPRFNGLNDFEQLITGLARELAAGNSP